jgi:hypothetical protein
VHFVVVFNLTRFARDKYDHFALAPDRSPEASSLTSNPTASHAQPKNENSVRHAAAA